jgi:hypothetical protein
VVALVAPAACEAHQLRRAQLVEQRGHLLWRVAGARQHLTGRGPPSHHHPLEQRSRTRAQLSEPAVDRALQSHRGLAGQAPLVDHVPRKLTHEEGAALRALDDRRSQRAVVAKRRDQALGERAGVRDQQRLELQRAHLERAGGGEGLAHALERCRGDLGTLAQQQQDRRRFWHAEQVVEQQRRVVVEEVQIVDFDDERLSIS